MKLFYTLILTLFLFFVQTFTAGKTEAQTTYYIKPIATGTADGSSWTNAGSNIQSALLSSLSGDAIWVAAGIYKPIGNYPSDRYGTFNLKNNVTIYGGFVGNETNLTQRSWKTNSTILTGDLLGDDIITANGSLIFVNNGENCYHVVRGTNVNNTAILDGFTIKGGNSNGGDGGGGLWNSSGSPTLRNIIFLNNSGTSGGGMQNESSSAPILNNIIFSRNAAFNAGGGMYNISSSPTLSNVIFSENITRGANSNGGGMYNFSASPTITNCNFIGNSSTDVGGGLCNAFSSPLVKNCIFWGNIGLGTNTQQIQSGGGSPSISYSIVEGSSVYFGSSNNNANPLFANASDHDGVDNIWMTSDDGLRIACSSPCSEAGTGTSPILDIIGNTRNGIIDIGTYESNNGSVASNLLSDNYTSVYFNQTAGVVNYTDCINQIIKIDGTSPNTIVGNVEAKVWIDAIQNPQFVKRHYQILPSNNANTATARITLYFTDADFNSFNTQTSTPPLFLPISTDAPATILARKANLLIEKRSGVGNSNGSFGSYSGAITNINPVDADIIWNGTANRWEVTFDVVGFSGFWVKTQVSILPLDLLSFTGTKTNNGNLLRWKTASELNTKSFELQRTSEIFNGQWETINTQTAIGIGTNNYNYTDKDKFGGNIFYRLIMIDIDDRSSKSNILKISNPNKLLSNVYPNPVADFINLTITDIKLINTQANLNDANGRTVKSFKIDNAFEVIGISNLKTGMYILKFANGETQKIIKY